MIPEKIRLRIIDFIDKSPENALNNEARDRAWDEALVGFASGADPLFDRYKDLVGPFHFTPLEIFNLTFPESPAEAGDLTVISWVLPQREITKADNRAVDFYPAERWVRTRIQGEAFNALLRQHLVRVLAEQGVPAVAPQLSPQWGYEASPRFGRASRWSERHAAYAAGLGTFGLCDGLITPKGKAHRAGSVVARIRVHPTGRRYEDHHAYCLYFFDGSCMACAERCPVGAISEQGHDKEKCREHVVGRCGDYARDRYGFEGYGCGLCQTSVPCESGIPAKILKTLDVTA